MEQLSSNDYSIIVPSFLLSASKNLDASKRLRCAVGVKDHLHEVIWFLDLERILPHFEQFACCSQRSMRGTAGRGAIEVVVSTLLNRSSGS
eukprot:774577-Amphidinium_carterae.1